MSLSEQIAGYALSFQYERIPEKVKANAKKSITDGIACIVAGSFETASRIALDYVKENGGAPHSTVLCAGGYKTNASSAAMLNTIAAHVCDYDDMSTTVNGHPTALILPAVLALGEKIGASGRDVFTAYVTGVEVLALFGRGLKNSNYKFGWNRTSTFGVIACTVACGRLLRLSKQQIMDAIGVAVGESSGTKGNYGFMAKDITVGRASAAGVFCAEMAQRGFKSNPDIFEGSFGMLEIVAPDIDLAAMQVCMETRISDFTSPGITIKPYPTCRGNHNAIDTMVEFKQLYGIGPEDIEKIRCSMKSAAFNYDKYHMPHNTTEAKFSAGYCMALVLLNGSLSIEDFRANASIHPAARSIIQNTEIELNPDRTGSQYGTNTQVYLKDGRVLEKESEVAKGDPDNPLSEAELIEKFLDCTQAAMSKSSALAIYDTIRSFDSLSSVCMLIDKLTDSYT